MSPFCSWYDVLHGIYETSGHISSASEYGCGVYANALDLFWSDTMSYEETTFRLLGT